MKKHSNITLYALYVCAIALIIALAIPGFSKAADLISGVSIKDNTVQAADLGTDVTRVKAVSVTVKPSQNDWLCPDEDAGNYDTCYQPDPGPGVQRYTVSCPSGNVTGGGVKLIDPEQGFNFSLYASYPSTDASWTFDLYNTGPDEIPVQLRVICI